MMALKLCTLLLLPTLCWSQALEQLYIDPDTITVSGLSAGGAFSTQYHVAFSNQISGVGVFAGVPFLCALQFGSIFSCMEYPATINAEAIIAETLVQESLSTIDDTRHMLLDKVYLYHGQSDQIVNHGILEKTKKFYERFSDHVKVVGSTDSNHCVPTENYGHSCGMLNEEAYLEKCGYNGLQDMFEYFFPDTTITAVNTTNYAGEVRPFDQNEFFSASANAAGMAETGYVYIPPQCYTSLCNLHTFFHGCLMDFDHFGDVFWVNSGLLAYADSLDMVVLLPQVTRSLSNPNGYWNWWGYLLGDVGTWYTQNGIQMKGINRMISHVAGI